MLLTISPFDFYIHIILSLANVNEAEEEKNFCFSIECDKWINWIVKTTENSENQWIKICVYCGKMQFELTMNTSNNSTNRNSTVSVMVAAVTDLLRLNSLVPRLAMCLMVQYRRSVVCREVDTPTATLTRYRTSCINNNKFLCIRLNHRM